MQNKFKWDYLTHEILRQFFDSLNIRKCVYGYLIYKLLKDIEHMMLKRKLIIQDIFMQCINIILNFHKKQLFIEYVCHTNLFIFLSIRDFFLNRQLLFQYLIIGKIFINLNLSNLNSLFI